MSQQILAPEPHTMAPSAGAERPASTFSEEEVLMFHNEDHGAAKLVVSIMAGVFTMGLALYIYIACLVSAGGH